ncbi:MAG TPA: hypothetical protein VJ768_04370, partial [Anaerolineales bacterium]|nr:hypothetical protein [Anaerolineales bacterium]
GVEPQPETTVLYESVLHGELHAPPEQDGKSTSAMPGLSHLPLLPTPFIGRRPDVDRLKALMKDADVRLLTLTGPGGAGKTRLSIQAASELEEAFPDGVFFAALAPVQTELGAIQTIARVIGFPFLRDEESPRQQLLDFLCEKQLLLILDNFEHLIEAVGLVRDILTAATGVKLVITSRVRLNLQGEQLYPVGGMSLPDEFEVSGWDTPIEQAGSFSGVQLFIDRARRVQPEFTLTKENLTSVLEIGRLVQGMPLGLELAAAWVELLPPEEIRLEISHNLDFLDTDLADIPDRQRSIRAVFESSWGLLTDEERETFLRLCVFVGSFSREAALKVSGASLRSLLGLANKSWLQQTSGGRFQLHELMRQYGDERLQMDMPAWREAKNRHAEYFARFVESQSQKMRNADQIAGFRALGEEYEGNIRVAGDWLVAERRWDDLIGRMGLGMFHFDWIRWGLHELIPWFRTARLSVGSETGHERRPAFAILATIEVLCEEFSEIKDADPIERLVAIWKNVIAYDLAEAMGFWFVLLALLVKARKPDSEVEKPIEDGITRLREPEISWELGICLLAKSNHYSQYVLDKPSLIEAGAIFRELGVIFEQGLVAEQLAKDAYKQRRPLAEIISYYNRAREFYSQLRGYIPRIGINLMGLADLYFRQGKYEEGFALFEEEGREMERMGQRRMQLYNKHWEALFAARYSTYERAVRSRQECYEMTRKHGTQSDLAWQLFEFGDVFRIFGEPEKSLNFLDQAHALFERMNMTLGLGFEQRSRGDLLLQEEEYAAALANYQAFEAFVRDDNHIWGIVQSRAKIALAHAYLGDLELSRLELRSALTEIYDIREDDLALQSMLAEAVCRVREGSLDAAVELASFLQHQPGSWNETKDHAGRILGTAVQSLPEAVVKAAIEHGKGLDYGVVVADLTGPG